MSDTLKRLNYRGDHTETYDHASGTGLIGKVVGPNADGQWYVVLDAEYDPLTDRTTAELQAIVSPDVQAGL